MHRHQSAAAATWNTLRTTHSPSSEPNTGPIVTSGGARPRSQGHSHQTGHPEDDRQARGSLEDPDLLGGIDPGDPLTSKGRIKNLKRTRDKESFDPDDPDRYRYKAYHIRRAFDLYGHLPTIINDGIKRRAKQAAGQNASTVQSDRDYETFQLILNHLEGLSEDIVRLKRNPKAFRILIRKIREAADQARNNDTANLKKDIACMLTPDGSSVLTVIAKGKKASSKHNRGFDNDAMGRYLCPISLDWDDDAVKAEIREGKHAILASDWPRLLYAGCDCNLDDLEQGLGRNMALVRASVVKYLFTGRSAAFSETAGGKTTRSGNAALAGMKAITPRVVAYAACMLRYAISNEESWACVDKEFNMQEFYWHVVSIFDDSDEFGKDLLAWWNTKIFGTSNENSTKTSTSTGPATLSMLRRQREAKRAGTRRMALGDITNQLNQRHTRTGSPESEDGTDETSHPRDTTQGTDQDPEDASTLRNSEYLGHHIAQSPRSAAQAKDLPSPRSLSHAHDDSSPGAEVQTLAPRTNSIFQHGRTWTATDHSDILRPIVPAVATSFGSSRADPSVVAHSFPGIRYHHSDVRVDSSIPNYRDANSPLPSSSYRIQAADASRAHSPLPQTEHDSRSSQTYIRGGPPVPPWYR